MKTLLHSFIIVASSALFVPSTLIAQETTAHEQAHKQAMESHSQIHNQAHNHAIEAHNKAVENHRQTVENHREIHERSMESHRISRQKARKANKPEATSARREGSQTRESFLRRIFTKRKWPQVWLKLSQSRKEPSGFINVRPGISRSTKSMANSTFFSKYIFSSSSHGPPSL